MSNDVPGESVSCPECGRVSSPGQRFCFCGHSLFTKPEDPPPKGIGGWLLWFCAQLLFLNPLLLGWRVVSEHRTLSANVELQTLMAPLVSIDSGIRIALAMLGIGTGILLVLRHRRAVALTHMYLIGFALVYLALAFLPFLFGYPVEFRNRLVGMSLYRAAVSVPATAFWVLYFKYSKRVEATYGTGSDHSEGTAA